MEKKITKLALLKDNIIFAVAAAHEKLKTACWIWTAKGQQKQGEMR